MEQDLASLRRFSEVMQQPQAQTGIAVRSLLHRLVELRGRARELPPEIEDLAAGVSVLAATWRRGRTAAVRPGRPGRGALLCEAPASLAGQRRVAGRPAARNPVQHCSTRRRIYSTRSRARWNCPACPANSGTRSRRSRRSWNLRCAQRPLAERNLLGVLTNGPFASSIRRSWPANSMPRPTHWHRHSKRPLHWKEPLSPDDTQNALAQALAFEKSLLPLSPAGVLAVEEDAAEPLRLHTARGRAGLEQDSQANLSAQHEAAGRAGRACASRRAASGDTDDVAGVPRLVERTADGSTLGASFGEGPDSATAPQSDEAGALIENLVGIQRPVCRARRARFAPAGANMSSSIFPNWPKCSAKLREQTGVLAELSPILGELAGLARVVQPCPAHAPSAAR